MIKTKIFNMCLEEYKIIQAKIDKIGEFKFKIRGWSFTLQSAALAGIFTHDFTKATGVTFFVALWLSVIFFNFIEQEQIVLVSSLSKRATILEKTLSRLALPHEMNDDRFMRLLLNELEGTPRIGVTLRNESRRGISHIFSKLFRFKSNMFFIFQYVILFIATIIYAWNICDNCKFYQMYKNIIEYRLHI